MSELSSHTYFESGEGINMKATIGIQWWNSILIIRIEHFYFHQTGKLSINNQINSKAMLADEDEDEDAADAMNNKIIILSTHRSRFY